MDPANYPDWWQTHTVLSDGATVEIRPIKPSDRGALIDFHGRQSQESIYFRFFRHRPELSDKELDFFTQVNYESRMAFVAIDGGRLVAVGRYEQGNWIEPSSQQAASDDEILEPEKTAEVAFFVDDANHGRGLATLLLEYLAAAARANNFTGFTASVLPENYRMLGVFRAAGFTTTTRFADGVIDVGIDLKPTETVTEVIGARSQRAASRSLGPLLEPQVVAIVGAGRRPGSLGQLLLQSAVGAAANGRFSGRVVAINPNTGSVAGVNTFPTALEASRAIGSVIDLAVVVVPPAQVLSVVEDCGAAGAHGLIVITSGFAERGGSGVGAQRELVAACRQHGMRLIGPNAFGLATTASSATLNLLSVPINLMAGSVGLASDSGLLAAAVIAQFELAGVGVSQVVGLGNQADVSIGELVGYWALHEPTKVVVLYSDQLLGPRDDTRLLAGAARMTSQVKPVVAVSPDDPDRAQLLSESGVILVDSVSELADQAALIACQPVPKGRSVAIVSNSASLARLSVVACRRHGLSPIVPDSAARGAKTDAILIDDLDEISQIFGPTVAISQAGSVADYENVIVATGVDQDVDAVVLALVPTELLSLEELGPLVDRINRSVDKPIVVVGLYDRSGVEIDGLPFYTFPDEAARALARSAVYGDWRRSVADVVGQADDSAWIDELLDQSESRHVTLADPQAADVAAYLGFPLAGFAVGFGFDEIKKQAEAIGYPVVLKLADGSGTLGESGGTAIDIHDDKALLAAYQRMSELWGSALQPAVVQRLVPHQLLARLDVAVDDELGPSMTIGLGGAGFETVEPLGRTFLPTSGSRLAEMLETFKANVDAGQLSEIVWADLAAIMETLARFVSGTPEVQSMSLNPILIGDDGASVANFAIELERAAADPLGEVRRLS